MPHPVGLGVVSEETGLGEHASCTGVNAEVHGAIVITDDTVGEVAVWTLKWSRVRGCCCCFLTRKQVEDPFKVSSRVLVNDDQLYVFVGRCYIHIYNAKHSYNLKHMCLTGES